MPGQKPKNDTVWEELFIERDILRDIDANGVHRIPAAIISKKREARLMTKFDQLINRPQIFSKNDLAILPDSRSSYVIGRFNCYEPISYDPPDAIIERAFPDWIQSLTASNLYSESSALLCAYHAGLLSDVLGEEVAFTVFGRMSTGHFDFSILAKQGGQNIQQPLTVDRAQCEIDGGFEGVETFVIIEVKNEAVDDFHIRQLYYPYRLWQNKISKRIVPVFLTYSNEIFTFSVYDFERPNEYNSLQLVTRKQYQIVPTDIEIADIRRILQQTPVQPEPQEIPFPQADRFERVIDLLGRLYAAGGTLAQEDITRDYAFDRRQTQYYTSAAIYLDLVEKSYEAERGVTYTLSANGMRLMSKAPKARNLALIEIILSRSVFRGAIEYYLNHAQPPSRETVLSLMRQAGLSINETTGYRRAQSVIGWTRWIMGLTTE